MVSCRMSFRPTSTAYKVISYQLPSGRGDDANVQRGLKIRKYLERVLGKGRLVLFG